MKVKRIAQAANNDDKAGEAIASIIEEVGMDTARNEYWFLKDDMRDYHTILNVRQMSKEQHIEQHIGDNKMKGKFEILGSKGHG